MPGRRAARVAERIRQEASQLILYELQDPRIRFVTVTKVDISSDLRHATIYVSVLGDEAARRTALRGLDSARGLVQSRLGRSLRLRETPAVRFEFDPSIEKSIELSKLIDQAAAEFRDRDEEAPHGADDEPDDASTQPSEGASDDA